MTRYCRLATKPIVRVNIRNIYYNLQFTRVLYWELLYSYIDDSSLHIYLKTILKIYVTAHLVGCKTNQDVSSNTLNI